MNNPGSGLLKTLTAVNEKSEAFVDKKIEEYKLLVEEHTTWLNEILIEVKKSFVSPKIQILPKTPSAKRARKRRKAAYTDTDNDDEDEHHAPPSKTRNTRGRVANDSASDFEDSAADTGRSTRSSRARGSRNAQSRSARSCAKSTKSSSRNQKSETSDEPASPVMSLMKGRDTILEVCEPTPTLKKTVLSVLGEVPAASPKTPVTISSNDNQKNTPIDVFTGLRVTPKTLVKNASPRSPRCIPNFATLNVKEQARAYEHMVSSSDEATPKMDRVKTLKSQTPNIGGSDSEYGTPSADSPMRMSELKTPQQSSLTPATPTTVIHVPQTPPTVVYTSEASVTLSNENTSKVKSRILKQVPSGSVSSTEKPASRRSSVRKSTSHRLSMRAGLKRSKMSLSKRKSSIMHYQAPSASAATVLEVIQSPLPQEDEIITVSPKVAQKMSASTSSLTGTPRQPGSRLRLKKSNRNTPTESPVPAPRRTTRTKTRQLASASSDDNVFSPTAVPKLTGRSTRTKSRQQTTSSSASSTGGSVSSPAGQNRRVTRSKLRSAKSATDLSDASKSGENEVSAPEGTTRITRTKARKRHHTESGDSASGETVLQENKRRKSEKKNDVSVVLIDDSGDEHVNHGNAPDDVECSEEEDSPRKPAFHTPTHPSSFLNALKKVKGSGGGSGQKMTGNLNGLVSSFIKRNTPKNKTALEKREEQKKELLKKRQQQEDRIQRIRDQRKKEVEFARKKREEHMKKVLAKKQQQEKELKENTKRTVEKTKEKVAITIQVREQKEKAEREKLQKMREKKLLEIEDRKKQEELVRLQKLKEKEEEERHHQEMLQRKREFEEKERTQKLLEERRLAEIKRHEMEEQKLKEQEQMRKQQDIQDQQRRKELEEKEKQLAKERAERTQQELERRKEKEKKLVEEREKERNRLQQQLADQRVRQEEEECRRKEQEKLKASIKQTNQANMHSSLNTSGNNSIYASSKMNTTFEKEKNTSCDSYPMTPQGKKRCDNYDIEDMNSDDSTDDEDKPRKETPAWANGASLKASLLNQYYRPPDIDVLFGYSDMPDLTVMFNRFKQKNRFKKRTSSAVWDSPMYKSPK
ncbi:inner centromere protein A-like [Lineus longissimus]|uniref:inner centromere protein A-like n=1 Tax=Lineus longissimus TaxID=88925 RepID=UPI002B4E5676